MLNIPGSFSAFVAVKVQAARISEPDGSTPGIWLNTGELGTYENSSRDQREAFFFLDFAVKGKVSPVAMGTASMTVALFKVAQCFAV